MLAVLVCPCCEKDVVLEVKDGQGLPQYTTEQVSDQFCRYNVDLHRSQGTHDDGTAIYYLEYIAMAWLKAEHSKCLMAPLRSGEIRAGFWDMPPGKALGIGGLTFDFYKTYQDLLIPHFVTLYEEMAETGSMPPSMSETLIVTMLKHDKLLYRPLSLLNVDTKMYLNILANRLLPMLPGVVVLEQADFIPGHSLTFNLWMLFGAMQQIGATVLVAAVFLDAEKAFDLVE
ncbi:hypothetical protein NDU88_007813 [Pleurodeles waltl]|uniref:Uncharacterized protein n=1 Tax=Pleurodeles waltl TaxID=8319 RepID=A0AAV7RTF8_PLEWA|nr:hypothetical protein NDU88_007813 [Pleurodeles waltl]